MILIAIGAFVLYAQTAPRAFTAEQIVDAPRENIGLVTTERAASGEGISIPLRHYDDLPRDVRIALTPRDAALADGRAYPQDFAGTVLLWILLFFLWKPLAVLFIPALSVITAFLLLQLGAELFYRNGPGRPSWSRPSSPTEGWSGFAVFSLWLAYPGLILNGSRLMDSGVPSLALLLLGMILFVRYIREGKTSTLIAFGVTIGSAIAIRYPNIVFAAPLAVLLLPRMRLKHLLVLGASTLPFAALILAFNQIVYGSPTTTGYHLSSELLRSTVNFEGSAFLRFEPGVAANHLAFYVVRIPLMLLPAIVGLGLMIFHLSKRERGARLTIAGPLLASGALLVYHLGQDTWGSSIPAVNASLIRYVLPVLGLGLLFLARAFRWEPRMPRRFSQGVLAVLTAASIATVIHAPLGLADRAIVIEDQQALKELILRETEPDALIAGRLSDRYLFPYRQSLTLTYLLRNEETTPRSADLAVWDHVPSPERLAEVAHEILARDIDLYLVYDFDMRTFPVYEAELRDENLELERIGSLPDPIPRLFHIVERS